MFTIYAVISSQQKFNLFIERCNCKVSFDEKTAPHKTGYSKHLLWVYRKNSSRTTSIICSSFLISLYAKIGCSPSIIDKELIKLSLVIDSNSHKSFNNESIKSVIEVNLTFNYSFY